MNNLFFTLNFIVQ